MRPATEALTRELAAVTFTPGGPPVVSNLDARPYADGVAWRDRSADHVSVPVRWRESVLAMVDSGATTFLEVGQSTMLAGLAKRTVPDVPVRGVATPDDAAALVLEEIH
jgi:[acyl-carrier-protein] S-malonyltransferase